MPQIGEIRKAKEINRIGGHKYIWSACIDCGKQRWIQLLSTKEENYTRRCGFCNGKNSPRNTGKYGESSGCWRGGRSNTGAGYIQIKLCPDDFFFPMAKRDGYVLEHRLVVAKALGRCLHSWEIVHHKHDKYPAGSDEDKQDNRYPENLQLVSDDRHRQITILEVRIKYLESKTEEQGKQIRLLKWQLKELETEKIKGVKNGKI